MFFYWNNTIEHFKFWYQYTKIVSHFVNYIVNNVITLYDSDCAIYIPPEETKLLWRFLSIIYTSIWLYMLRVIVLEYLFLYSINFNLGHIWFLGGMDFSFDLFCHWSIDTFLYFVPIEVFT